MHRHQQRQHRRQAERREVLFGVVRQFFLERRVDGVADRHHQQRVAVGIRARGQLRRHDAVGAGAVVHDDLLPPGVGQLLAEHARQDVGRATGRERNQYPDWTIRIRLRRRGNHRQCAGKEKSERGNGKGKLLQHFRLPPSDFRLAPHQALWTT